MRYFIVGLLAASSLHAATLKELSQTLSDETTQKIIAARACGITVDGSTKGPDGGLRFITGGSWVRLSETPIFSDTPAYMIVTCERGRGNDEHSMSAVTYAVFDSGSPVPLTDGYAHRERAGAITVPGFGRPFIAIERSFVDDPGPFGAGTLVDISSPGETHIVWQSGPRMPGVRWGFADVDGQLPAELVTRAVPARRGDVYNGSATAQTAAFRWNGTHFEAYDTFATRLNALSDDIFTLGGQ